MTTVSRLLHVISRDLNDPYYFQHFSNAAIGMGFAKHSGMSLHRTCRFLILMFMVFALSRLVTQGASQAYQSLKGHVQPVVHQPTEPTKRLFHPAPLLPIEC
jgi:hypothetical protein